MKLPFELRQKNVILPTGMTQEIEERAQRLDRFFDRVMRCRITVEGPGLHHRQGRYSVKIDLTVPGAKIVVQKAELANLELALKEAFDAVGRRLEGFVRKMRGFVKVHAAG
jgi:ribosome-associated translation inhibitor RaiA